MEKLSLSRDSRLLFPVRTTLKTSSSPTALTFGRGTVHLPCKKREVAGKEEGRRREGGGKERENKISASVDTHQVH